MKVKISFYFDPGEDYSNYPRFCSTDRWVISAKMHRLLLIGGTEAEIDEKWLPVFIYERRAERRTKRGYVNVNVRYKAYYKNEVREYKNYIKFIKDLQEELEKNKIENEVTKLVCEFSKYDKLPPVTLYQKFFPDEVDKIETELKSKIRKAQLTDDRLKDLNDSIVKADQELFWLKRKIDYIEGRLRYIDDFLNDPDPKLVKKIDELDSFRHTISEIVDKIEYIESGLNNKTLKEIKKKFYAILSDLKGLSLTKKEMIKLILPVTNEEYRMLKSQLDEILSLAQKHLRSKHEEIEAELNKRLDELRAKKTELEHWKKEVETEFKKELAEYEIFVRKEIRKSIVDQL